MDPSPRMIFFDVGETLVRPRKPFGDLLREIAREIDVDVPEAAFSGLARHIDGRIIERTRRGMPFTFPPNTSQRFWFDTYDGFLGQFLTPVDADRLTRRLLDLLSSPHGYELYADTRVTLDRLRRRGYRLGVISNWEAWLPALLAELGIADAFDQVVISGECGFEKPDGRIFDYALRESGHRPEEVIYVGDRPNHDVKPALEVGITPILLDRDARYPADARFTTIRSLHDLVLALDDTKDWLSPPDGLTTGQA
jgi:putative hydrolase of the HAD superfamily